MSRSTSDERKTPRTHPLPETCDPVASKLSAKERLAAFEAIWFENKDRIRMPKPVNYPINYKAGMRWAKRHCDPDSSRFAELLVTNTMYVSFVEFMTSLERICKSFIATYSDRSSDFVLILPFDMTKSNVWVSLLAWPWLKSIVTDIDFSITSAYNKRGDRPMVCIVCDDCAYTGNQLMSYCALKPSELQYPGKPEEPSARTLEWIEWNNTVSIKAAELEKGVSRDTFAVALMIPYMSTHAQSNITAHPFILAPRDVKIFQIFRERVPIHEFNQGAMREFESTFQYHSNISAIYFDHKVADAVSTFNKIYLMAPVFGCGNLRASVCFIDGCCNSRAIPEGLNVYDVHMNIEDILKQNSCPPTFYKSLKYTYNGRPTDHLCVQALINGRPSAPHHATKSRR